MHTHVFELVCHGIYRVYVTCGYNTILRYERHHALYNTIVRYERHHGVYKVHAKVVWYPAVGRDVHIGGCVLRAVAWKMERR